MYELLKKAVADVVKQNGNQEITGQNLQETLFAMINSLGKYAGFAGVADESTMPPSTPDEGMFYIAVGYGRVMPNFGVNLPLGLNVIERNGNKWKGTLIFAVSDVPTESLSQALVTENYVTQYVEENGGVGRNTPEGGQVFNSYSTNHAGENSAVFGKSNLGYPKNSIVAGSGNSVSGSAVGSAVFGGNHTVEPAAKASMVAGIGNNVRNDAEVAFGRYNQSEENKTAFSFGDGKSAVSRSNLFEVHKDGNVFIRNVGGYDGKNSTAAKSLQSVLTEIREDAGANKYNNPADASIYTLEVGATNAEIKAVLTDRKGRVTIPQTGDIFNGLEVESVQDSGLVISRTETDRTLEVILLSNNLIENYMMYHYITFNYNKAQGVDSLSIKAAEHIVIDPKLIEEGKLTALYADFVRFKSDLERKFDKVNVVQDIKEGEPQKQTVPSTDAVAKKLKAVDAKNAEQDEKLATLEGGLASLSENVEDIENRVNNLVGYYGVEKIKSTTDPNFSAVIGREDMQIAHPILHDFCISKVKDGKVVARLNEVNWNQLADGSPSNVVFNSAEDDDDTDILDCNRTGFYAILGDQSTEYEIWAFGYKPFSHRGVQAVYIPPFGDCPDFSVIKGGVQRSIRDNTTAGSNGAGSFGIAAYNEKGYPSTSVSRFNYEVYARKKNTPNHVDNKENIPYTGAFQLDRRVWAGLLFVKFKTKDLHALSLLGGGISANDGGGNREDTWLQKSGYRIRTSASEPWKYLPIDGSRWSNTNGYKPLLKMFDCQLALSHAYANKIAEKQQFEYDGATWQYTNVAGSNGIADGEMTAIVTKVVKSADGNTELCLVQPIVCGRIAGWGNIYKWVSGIECICRDTETRTYDIYQTDDVTKLTTDSDASDHEPNVPYPFEETYVALEKGKPNREGYMSETYNNSLMGNLFGGSLHTGSCQYAWYTGTCGTGKKGRRGVLFGVKANNSICALRSTDANYAPSSANAYFGGGFRVTLKS